MRLPIEVGPDYDESGEFVYSRVTGKFYLIPEGEEVNTKVYRWSSSWGYFLFTEEDFRYDKYSPYTGITYIKRLVERSLG